MTDFIGAVESVSVTDDYMIDEGKFRIILRTAGYTSTTEFLITRTQAETLLMRLSELLLPE